MRRIPTVRPREHTAPKPRGAPRAAVAPRAAIGQSGAERRGLLDIAHAVVHARADPLLDGELALENLASATNGAEWIPLDDEDRRIGGHLIALVRSDLLFH